MYHTRRMKRIGQETESGNERRTVFYTNPMSRGRIVRWMLEEVGQPYRTEILDYGHSMKGPEYLAVNPMGKVPAIRHGETVVTEAAAICAYLADAFPAAGLAPPLGRQRARALLPLAVFRRRPGRGGGHRQGARRRDSGRAEADGRLRRPRATRWTRWKARVTGREYIAGDRFTAADVYVGSQIGWGMAVRRDRKASGFRALLGGCSPRARPTIRAKEIDDKLVEERRKAG